MVVTLAHPVETDKDDATGVMNTHNLERDEKEES